MRQITIFKDFSDTKNPIYSDVDAVLERIRACKLQPELDIIRATTDEKEKKRLKGLLPCILFAGKFTKRADKALAEHSGLMVLDWDHLEDVNAKKDELKQYPYIYALFGSPSGDGLKGVVRVPAIIEKHRGYYSGLLKIFPELDSTSINESRICYASADADIYINKDAVEFDEYIEPEVVKKEITYPSVGNRGKSNQYKLATAATIIQNAPDGQKHKELVKASKLLGGCIDAGIVTEYDAIELLEREIQKRNIDDFKAAQKTIRDGIEYGKAKGLIEDEKYSNNNDRIKWSAPKEPEVNLEETEDGFNFIATRNDTEDYISRLRNGTFKMGLKTGFPTFDQYFRFKEGNLVVINGHDNVGKSLVVWYLAVLSNIQHGWKWIIFSSENNIGTIVRKLIEFRLCEEITKLTDEELEASIVWVFENFKIIKNDAIYTYTDVLAMGEKLVAKEDYKGFMIDPYNSLLKKCSAGGEHEYDYKAASEMRLFASKHNCSIYLNCHAVTSALRMVYPKNHINEGLPMPPNKADTEGGGKFANRADDFLTIHRMTQHKTDWMITEIHVRKIKETETGGKSTPYNDPFKLRMMIGGCGFEDASHFSPIRPKWFEKIVEESNVKVHWTEKNEKEEQTFIDYDNENPPF